MSIEYIERDEGGEVLCCDSCGCPAPTSDFNWGPGAGGAHKRPMRALCEFCSSTMASRHTEYPSGDEYGALRAEIWRAAGAIFNMLRATKTPPPGATTDRSRR